MRFSITSLILLASLSTSLTQGLEKKDAVAFPSIDAAVGEGSIAAAKAKLDKDIYVVDKTKGQDSKDSKVVDKTKGSALSTLKEVKLSDGIKGEEHETPKRDGQLDSFLMSISMIFVSEIGDKTFLIAALMSMRSPRLIVFTAAASALVLMTILSGIVGHALPTLISQRITQFLASILFIIFGYKLFREGMEMSNEVGVNDEVAEVEEELAMHSVDAEHDLESGRPQIGASSESAFNKYVKSFKSLLGFVLSPTWVQVFVLTFLGEWGDRSQIATIALAAGSDYWAVILGGCIGHTICTAIAVIGGMVLASRISMRQITLGGSVTFFAFAIWYLYEAVYGDHDV